MNSKLLNTALVLTPKKLQSKAVAKALNFLFPSGALTFKEERTLRLEVTDLKRHWMLKIDHAGCQPATGNRNADITVRASLEVILAAQDCRQLHVEVNTGHIEVIANPQDKALLEAALQTLTQRRLDELVEVCYTFFKLKPKRRLDLKSVTLADIQTGKDVDWIRDEAVKLESSNLVEALRLMELAHQARPNGPFIRRKVEEYRAALGAR